MRTIGKPGITIGLAVLSFVALARTADAYTGELYVYNGFGPVTGALRSIALIFSDARYNGLFISIVILGMLFGMMTALFKAGMGMRIGLLSSWLIPILIGVTLYIALVVPKGTIWVYDDVKNRHQAISGVPDGMIVILTLLNKIERGLVDIIETSGFVPFGTEYSKQAGGVGFNMLLGVGRNNGILFSDLYINQSLNKYVDDCVWWGMNNPNLPPADVISSTELASNTDFLPILAKAAYWPIYTVYYDINTPGGVTGTCHDIWTNKLKPQLTDPANYKTVTDALCAQAGYDPTIPAERSQCLSATSSALNWVENTAGAYTTQKLLQQAAIARSIDTIVRKYSPDAAIRALTARNAGTSMMSTGVAANEWIPLVRAVTMAIALGLTPLLILFLPTPLFPKAVAMFLGFFVWITAWGVTDAIVHQFAMNQAVDTFAELRRHQLGYHAIMMFETASMKTLAIFGAIRWTGAMLATVMTMMLIRFGGHAMAAFAGQLTAMPQRAGAGAGMDTITPEGSARLGLSQSEAAAYWANAHKYGFTQRMEAAQLRGGTAIQGATELINERPGGVDQAITDTGHASAIRQETIVGGTENLDANTAKEIGAAGAAANLAKVEQLKILANGKANWKDLVRAAEKIGLSNVSHTGQVDLGGTKLQGRAISAFNHDGKEVAKAFTGYADRKQLEGLADWGDSHGQHVFANYMGTLAGELKNDNDRVAISMTGDANGWATLKAEHGASVRQFDLANKEAMDTRKTGTDHQEINRNTNTFDKGYHPDGTTAAQAARRYDSSLYHALTDPRLKPEQQKAIATSLAQILARNMMSQEKGTDSNSVDVTAGARVTTKAGVSILGTGGGASASAGTNISGKSASTETVDTRAIKLRNVILNDLDQSRGLPREQRDQFIAKDVGNYINNSDEEALKEKFGVNKPTEYIKDVTEEVGNVTEKVGKMAGEAGEIVGSKIYGNKNSDLDVAIANAKIAHMKHMEEMRNRDKDNP